MLCRELNDHCVLDGINLMPQIGFDMKGFSLRQPQRSVWRFVLTIDEPDLPGLEIQHLVFDLVVMITQPVVFSDEQELATVKLIVDYPTLPAPAFGYENHVLVLDQTAHSTSSRPSGITSLPSCHISLFSNRFSSS